MSLSRYWYFQGKLMKRTAFCVAAGLLACALSGSSMRGECRELNDNEAAKFVGGAIGPGACVKPTEQGSCNYPDLSCSVGSNYCSEIQASGYWCGSNVIYKNPTRCQLNSQPGILTCCDDEGTTLQNEVQCSITTMCVCEQCQNCGTWNCVVSDDEDDIYENNVPQCFVKQCTGE